MSEGELILYTTEAGDVQLQLRAFEGTVLAVSGRNGVAVPDNPAGDYTTLTHDLPRGRVVGKVNL